ncbi:MAG: putative tricarboxylic transport membrane protein [Granulosicoccus sp.]|jgi:putative tricarboxylic transport membrane protein
MITTISRDTLVSIALLVFCGFLIWAGFQIRDPQFGELSPAAWPKAVSYVLTFFCLIYLAQSLMADKRKEVGSDESVHADASDMNPGFFGWLQYYANPIICFAVYFLFLFSLPYLGTLIGGIALVFTLMSVLGGIQPRQIGLHLLISVITVGAMWALFTFGLRVLLPRGVLIPGI